MLKFRSGSLQSEWDLVTPHTTIVITDIRDMDITHAATTVVHLITERLITVVGPTTGTDTTTIITAIITATKSTRYRKVNCWLGRDSKPAFLLGLFCCFNATLTEKIL